MQYKIIVDKQSRVNPSSEKKEYVIDIEELRCKGNVYDSLVITKDEDYVIRKLELSEYGILSVLSEPIKQPLENINIELFEGDNYIYLVDHIGNKFYAEYLIKNEFNDLYVKVNEMNSAISQTAQGIEFNVNQKLTEYATNEKVEADVTELNSKITQTATEINLEVRKKVSNTELTGANIALRLNNDTSEAQIKADKININGVISANNNFKVDANGNMIARNGTFNGGKIELIGGTQAKANFIVKSSSSESERTFITPKDIYITSDDGGIYINSDTSTKYCAYLFNSNSDPQLYLSGQGDTRVKSSGITTPKLTQTSLKYKKKNIKKLNVDAIKLVRNADICEYNFKGEKTGSKKHIGLVIGEGYNCPSEVISEDGQGVEQYSLTSLLWKAVQELTEEVENLKKEVHNAKN